MEDKKFALVLCNVHYPHATCLPGGIKDHKKMISTLTACEFDHPECTACIQQEADTTADHTFMDLDGEAMVAEFDTFVERIKHAADNCTQQKIITLFYYSGHGISDQKGTATITFTVFIS
jgi:hypothetical protein